jgi:hypothetical protein
MRNFPRRKTRKIGANIKLIAIYAISRQMLPKILKLPIALKKDSP